MIISLILALVDDKALIAQYLRQLPKAELHVHLEGSVTHNTLLELASRNRVDLSAPVNLGGYEVSPPGGIELAVPTFSDFPSFISYYLKIAQCIKTADDILLISDRYAESAGDQGIVASEIYFTPTTFISLGANLSELLDGLRAAQERARQVYKQRFGWIFDIVRSIPGDGSDTLEIAIQARSRGINVVGLGLAGYERDSDVSRFGAVFDRAIEQGFVCFAHAGETAGPKSIRETMYHLTPSRIGHGVRAMEDPELIKELARLQIPLEVSPWSNIKLNLFNENDHPVQELIAQGLNVVLAADDPGIFGKSLIDNYLFAHQKGVTIEELDNMARRSLELVSIS